MNTSILRKSLLVAAVTMALAAPFSSPAQADPPWKHDDPPGWSKHHHGWSDHRGWHDRDGWRDYRYSPPAIIYGGPRVIYVPPPPVIYVPPPSGLNIIFPLDLR